MLTRRPVLASISLNPSMDHGFNTSGFSQIASASERRQLGAQRLEVIDLTVVGDPNPPRPVAHRLVPGRRQVEGRQPAVSEGDVTWSTERVVCGHRGVGMSCAIAAFRRVATAKSPKGRLREYDVAFVVWAAMTNRLAHGDDGPRRHRAVWIN